MAKKSKTIDLVVSNIQLFNAENSDKTLLKRVGIPFLDMGSDIGPGCSVVMSEDRPKLTYFSGGGTHYIYGEQALREFIKNYKSGKIKLLSKN